MTDSTPATARACVFCQRIERGEFGHANAVAVTFEPLNPVTPGHLLVVPREHVTDATANPDLTGMVMATAARHARELRGDCNLITSVGTAATQTIRHLHVHVVPRREGDGLTLPWTGQEVRNGT